MNNRYNDKEGRIPVKEVTIETVDQAFFDYFDKRLKLFADSPSGKRKVSVMFSQGERWALIKKQAFRDSNGTLILPLISLNRTGIDRTPGLGGMGVQVPNIVISKVIHGKTPNLQNLLENRRLSGFPQEKKDKLVYEINTLPFPDFAIAQYSVTIWSQFQTQMNDIIQNIFSNYKFRNSFVMPVDYDGDLPKGNSYYFVGLTDPGSQNSQSNFEEFSDTERLVRYTYTVRIPFYLLLNPTEETLSYGNNEKTGKKEVYKFQNSPNISLKEKVVTEEEFIKLFKS